MPVNGSESILSSLEGMAARLDAGRVPAWVLNDPEIYSLELDRVFGRAWTFLGHESEVAAPGDYVLRYIGEDPFIFLRDEQGEIRVFFDACRHRGVQLCRAEKGNSTHFRCPYHGWTYRNDGRLIGIPQRLDAFPALDRSQWGLIAPAQVDSIHGLVFATLDADAPSLREYLGGMTWYLDLMVGLHPAGLQVVGEPQRWIMDSNWKSAAENFGGDDYHTLFLHKSMAEVGALPIDARANMEGYHVHVGNGHAMSASMAAPDESGGPRFWGFPRSVTSGFDRSAVSAEQFDIAERSRVSVGNVFPNLSFLISPLTVKPKSVPPVTVFSLRQWQPRGPKQTEAWVWFFCWEGTPEDVAMEIYEAGLGTFSAAGMFEQDDAEPWQSIARTAGTTFARTANLEFNYEMGLDGNNVVEADPDWPGPGVAYHPRFEDGLQRGLYRRWLDYMATDAYPPNREPDEPGKGAK